jgi:hypothetical protein
MEGDVGLRRFSNTNKKRLLYYSCSMLMANIYLVASLGSIQASVDTVDGPYRPPNNTVLLRPANELHTQQLDYA